MMQCRADWGSVAQYLCTPDGVYFQEFKFALRSWIGNDKTIKDSFALHLTQHSVHKYKKWCLNPHAVHLQKDYSTQHFSTGISVSSLSCVSRTMCLGDWTRLMGTKSVYYWALGNPNTLAQGGTLSQAALGTAQLATWPLAPCHKTELSGPWAEVQWVKRMGCFLAASYTRRLKGAPSLPLGIVFFFPFIIRKLFLLLGYWHKKWDHPRAIVRHSQPTPSHCVAST